MVLNFKLPTDLIFNHSVENFLQTETKKMSWQDRELIIKSSSNFLISFRDPIFCSSINHFLGLSKNINRIIGQNLLPWMKCWGRLRVQAAVLTPWTLFVTDLEPDLRWWRLLLLTSDTCCHWPLHLFNKPTPRAQKFTSARFGVKKS